MDDLTSSFPIINNRYQISSTIATGGMAVIYNAQDLMLERPVALKILRKSFPIKPFKTNSDPEARASAGLIHPNIVTTFDFGYDKDRLFIAMEYIDGAELKTMMEEDNPSAIRAFRLSNPSKSGSGLCPPVRICSLRYQTAKSADHRRRRLKITDFGISRALDTISREEQSDVVWGSPFYISPEQAAANLLHPRQTFMLLV